MRHLLRLVFVVAMLATSTGMIREDGQTGCEIPPGLSALALVESAPPPCVFHAIEAIEEPGMTGMAIGRVDIDPPGDGGGNAETNDLSWTFTSSIPADIRTYILQLWSDIRIPMRTVAGPPSRNLTVSVSYNPGIGGGGLYSPSGNSMILGRLPASSDDQFFNEVFTHETFHAFQDAALDAGMSAGWAIEGTAVCVTSMVRECLIGRRQIFSRWSLEYLSEYYDAYSQMGPDALGGTSDLWGSISVLHSYPASGGVWWLLAASQADAPSGDWMHHTWLADFFGRLFATGRPMTQQAILQTIEETAVAPIDGLGAGDWIARQPIVNNQGAAGKHMWAASIAGGVAFQPFRRLSTGGSAYPMVPGSAVLRLRGAAGEILWEMNRTWSVAGGFGYQYVSGIPWAAGANVLEIDSSALGVAPMYLTHFNEPPVTGKPNSGPRNGLVFFDPENHRVVTGPIRITDGEIIGSENGGHLVQANNYERNPSSFAFVADGFEGVLSNRRTIPLPFARFLRINKPMPRLSAVAVLDDARSSDNPRGNGNGAAEYPERIGVKLRITNSGDAPSEPMTFSVRWTNPATDALMPWRLTLIQADGVAPGATVDTAPFRFDVATPASFLAGEYQVETAGVPFLTGTISANANPTPVELVQSPYYVYDTRRSSSNLLFAQYGTADNGLMHKNLATGTTTNITPKSSPGNFALRGSTAVSVTYSYPAGSAIEMIDLETGARQGLDADDPTTASWIGGDVTISDSHVAWTVLGPDYQMRIKLLDRAKGSTRLIGDAGARAPKLAGDRIAFLQGNRCRFMDLRAGTDRVLASTGAYDFAFDGTRVAWTDGAHIKVLDVASDVLTQFSQGTLYFQNVMIEGDWVIARTWLVGGSAFWIHSLSRGTSATWQRGEWITTASLVEGHLTWVEGTRILDVTPVNPLPLIRPPSPVPIASND